jgi:hypothetical protein
MAGKVVVSTLNNDTGVLATQNGMTGIAKAWVNFNGTGTVAILGSFNVSSITDNGTGDYTVNFTTAMPNANYAVSGTNAFSSSNSSVYAIKPRSNTDLTTTSVRILSTFASGGTTDVWDANIATVTVHSS